MNKTLLTLLFLFLSLFTFSQSNCITVNSAVFTNPSGDDTTFTLTINWSTRGMNHLVTYVMSGNDTIYDACTQVSNPGSSSGSITYNNIIAPGGLTTLSAVFERWSGPCGNGSICGPNQFIPRGGVLNIKLEKIIARRINSYTTEIRFKVASSFGSKNTTFSLKMKSGEIKKYNVQMPQNLRAGESWMVVLNHKTGSYTTIKL